MGADEADGEASGSRGVFGAVPGPDAAAVFVEGGVEGDRMPLPVDVGEVIVAYLQNGRAGSARHLFVAAKVPHRPFTSSLAVRRILHKAFARTGLKPPQGEVRSHVLRHSLAVDMLGQGASLDEISEVLRHPTAWTAADIGGKDTFAFDLTDRHIAAFEAAVDGLRERGLTAFEDIGRDGFPLDAIANDVRAWRHEVADGRGLLLLREFPVDRWSQEEAELVWFGLGAHFGRAVSQSALGDLLGHVVNVGGDDMRARAYRNARELRMHTDRCDTVGMFCLRRAKSGGESGYSSALAVHNRIREIKPELLESIWNGVHLHRFGEQPPGEPPYTPIRIPVFSERDGVITMILIGGYAWMAADEFDAPFSNRDRETLATFERLAADPEFRLTFQPERGEAALFNN